MFTSLPNKSLLEALFKWNIIVSNNHWIWIGAKGRYGHLYYKDKYELAHRISAYLYLNFDLKSNLFVLHKIECHNPLCVNPEHLYIGTSSDNVIDSVYNNTHHHSRKTHCRNGHEFNNINTYHWKNGWRSCRICRKIAREKSNKI